ncbi:type I restriction enzyme HsdR N-terminal domain-containing protein [Rufibacter sediminis]|uniref:Type I restriction enzyme HsdR N-terminal domain-containing protein n=1 Tax=Rufibacter sediminis TaxID=2762756 RepID=A0ABR6W0V7_9BACT|nr:type I restriction enzyme HsdR N-terminal domain-containing protein [Rufibacter sediminis]MBC3542331.1 type I restriction enzyme HsdR N-terminal domain-containing protein [Rufibacter sediminis]
MEQLSLPAFSYKLKDSGGKTFILDQVRRKYVLLTPEEWVRQHIVYLLHAHLHYPLALMSVERGTTYNTLQKRTDLRIYSTEGTPLLLVECKAAHVPITEATVRQVAVYNQTIAAPYLMVSNGREHYCWHVHPVSKQITPIPVLPSFQEISLKKEL